MSQYVYVYVPDSGHANFLVGLDRLVWGWKQPARGGLASTATMWLQSPSERTYMVFAHDVQVSNPPRGWPRTAQGDLTAWQTATFSSVSLGRLAGPLYESSEPVWVDDVYPYRVPLESVVPLPDLPPGTLPTDALAAVRDSALRQGRPVLGPAPLPESHPLVIGGDDEDGPTVPDRLLDGTEELDGVALALVRREQSKLRQALLGNKELAGCSLCGRTLPVGLIRLAHIKRRASCNSSERLNTANTMAACTLGCDELFERGYLVVDDSGQVRGDYVRAVTDDLRGALEVVEGRPVGGFHQEQVPFFSWHRARHSAAEPVG